MGKNLGLPLISATKLDRNNQNEYVPKLDLLTKESAKVAQEVITNALNLVYSARAKLQGQSEGLDKSVNFLNSSGLPFGIYSSRTRCYFFFATIN